MEYQSKYTRFRAYQLGTKGSSFSYFDGSSFTLIEARLTEINASTLYQELKLCEKDNIDCLHITSWDSDHCNLNELKEIIRILQPTRIEYPGYNPHYENGISSRNFLSNKENSFAITPDYVNSLRTAQPWEYINILYNNRKDYEEPNNNSSIKLFRTGCYIVLSLGDVEKDEIANYLMRVPILKDEVDIMILAHHGADNGFTTDEFVKYISSSVAICSSNFDSEYDHPKQHIRDILYENGVDLYTTKTGDVVIESIKDNTIAYRSINLKANSSEISSVNTYNTKRYLHWK